MHRAFELSTVFLFLITAIAGSQEPRAILTAHVISLPDGGPVPEATVVLRGTPLAGKTDSLGNVTLKGVAQGRYVVEAKRVGFASATAAIRAGSSDTIELVLGLRTVAETLKTVKVIDTATRMQLQEFESRRRNHSGGFFFDETAIRAAESSRISELLKAKVPGLVIQSGPDQRVQIFSARGPTDLKANGGARPCPVEIFLDRVRLTFADAAIVPLSELGGIEYYPPGFAPPQYRVPPVSDGYGGSQCGVLLMWRRP